MVRTLGRSLLTVGSQVSMLSWLHSRSGTEESSSSLTTRRSSTPSATNFGSAPTRSARSSMEMSQSESHSLLSILVRLLTDLLRPKVQEHHRASRHLFHFSKRRSSSFIYRLPTPRTSLRSVHTPRCSVVWNTYSYCSHVGEREVQSASNVRNETRPRTRSFFR